jgi:hypothetical protein
MARKRAETGLKAKKLVATYRGKWHRNPPYCTAEGNSVLMSVSIVSVLINRIRFNLQDERYACGKGNRLRNF